MARRSVDRKEHEMTCWSAGMIVLVALVLLFALCFTDDIDTYDDIYDDFDDWNKE